MRVLLRRRFGHGVFPGTEEERTSRRHQARLGVIAEHQGHTNVIVRSGENPFPGFGDRTRGWSMALQLGDPDLPRQARFTPKELYDHISMSLESLRGSPFLTPGWRLRDLALSRQAVVTAAELLDHHALDIRSRAVLPDPAGAPVGVLAAEELDSLVNASPEWIRYYLHAGVESWRQDLVVSAFLHIGADHRTLYLEWHGLTLGPVTPEYRALADTASQVSTVLARTSYRLLTLPVQLLRHAWQLTRRPADGISPTASDLAYGARRSLRELAAGPVGYTDRVDAERHLKLLESTTLTAVERFLTERGISTNELRSRADALGNATLLH
ncbi:hypothetical protein D5S17_27100 [Pseudonocardiaceae bacterium YIM PH 21723]|nr:hypothetical protein D5S17_27100 [Pseudonocardiaceae bacterium YIM PH 21723]